MTKVLTVTFEIDPVLYLTSSGSSSHMTFLGGRLYTVCGRPLDFARTNAQYEANSMFLLDICTHCQNRVEKMIREGDL